MDGRSRPFNGLLFRKLRQHTSTHQVSQKQPRVCSFPILLHSLRPRSIDNRHSFAFAHSSGGLDIPFRAAKSFLCDNSTSVHCFFSSLIVFFFFILFFQDIQRSRLTTLLRANPFAVSILQRNNKQHYVHCIHCASAGTEVSLP